jgi:UDP-3-O-[3-hydroxymyristoyl] glucosamine N-acyltransferase
MGRLLKYSADALLLVQTLGLTCQGAAQPIRGASALATASAGDLCFVKSAKFVDHVVAETVVITTLEFGKRVVESGCLAIISENPRLDFARALTWLEVCCGFHWSTETPWVHPTASLGANVVLGQGVRIGANTRIMNNVVIGNEVIIGSNCIIKSGAVIGEEGFGFERGADGKAVRLPHIGGVVIEDDVEVGSLTTVCRGTLSDTRLGRGAKVDDHVHIAHNVLVGEDSFVIACAEVSGGVVIGQGAWIAPCATIMNQVTIGDRAVIGLGAVVLKNVDAGQVVVGNPGKPLLK